MASTATQMTSGVGLVTEDVFVQAYLRDRIRVLAYLKRRFKPLYTDAKELMEDCVQEAYTRIWAHKDNIRDPEMIGTYAVRVAINVYLSWMRHDRIKLAEMPDYSATFSYEEHPDHKILLDELIAVAPEILETADTPASKSRKHRAVILCRMQLGLTIEPRIKINRQDIVTACLKNINEPYTFAGDVKYRSTIWAALRYNKRSRHLAWNVTYDNGQITVRCLGQLSS